MNTKPDGGPAFPMPLNETTSSCSPVGMTLRDYFAAKALNGFITNEELVQTCIGMAVETKTTPEYVAAIRAYKFADAMLEAREK